MSNLKIHKIPVPAGYEHPDIPVGKGILPCHEFTMGVIAPKGAGKTTVMANLMEKYKGFFHTILVFSPTIQSDEKWDWVKEQLLRGENVELKKWAKKKMEEINNEKEGMFPRPPSKDLAILADDDQEGFDPKIPEECFFENYDDDTFMNIMEEQNCMIKLLKKHGGPKYLANRVLIIFDDLVGSPLFAGSRGSYFKGINTRHRHFSASFMMVSQGYKEVPKTIRTGWTCLIIFDIGNDKEVESIWEEYGMGLSFDEWLEVYDLCTDDDHGFMFINLQRPKRKRMMKNFEIGFTHVPDRKKRKAGKSTIGLDVKKKKIEDEGFAQ